MPSSSPSSPASMLTSLMAMDFGADRRDVHVGVMGGHRGGAFQPSNRLLLQYPNSRRRTTVSFLRKTPLSAGWVAAISPGSMIVEDDVVGKAENRTLKCSIPDGANHAVRKVLPLRTLWGDTCGHFCCPRIAFRVCPPHGCALALGRRAAVPALVCRISNNRQTVEKIRGGGGLWTGR